MRFIICILFIIILQSFARGQQVFRFDSFKETVLLIYEGNITKPNSIGNGILVKDQKAFYGRINYSEGIFTVSKEMNKKKTIKVSELSLDSIEVVEMRRLEDFRVVEDKIPYSIMERNTVRVGLITLYGGSNMKIYSKEYRILLKELDCLFGRKKNFIVPE